MGMPTALTVANSETTAPSMSSTTLRGSSVMFILLLVCFPLAESWRRILPVWSADRNQRRNWPMPRTAPVSGLVVLPVSLQRGRDDDLPQGRGIVGGQ